MIFFQVTWTSNMDSDYRSLNPRIQKISLSKLYDYEACGLSAKTS